MCLITHFLAFDISKNFMTVMGMGMGDSGIGKKWEWEWFYGNGREWEQK